MDTIAGQALPKLAFGYDAYGNRKLIRRNHFAATSEVIGYTADNQVNTWAKGAADASGAIAMPSAWQGWTLDSRGNWSDWAQNGTAQSRTHTAANELTAMGGTALTWDAAGNLTSDGALTYVWGARGMLDTAKQGSVVNGVYGYDPLGRRALKTVGGLKTISVYDGWQCVWQKVTGSGTDTTKTYLYGDYIDEPLAMIRSWGSATDTVWYLQGNNYNVEALTDRTGAVVERYEYTPYGNVTVYTGKGADGKWFTSDDVTASVSAKGNALTLQGRELDAETGVMYFRNRYYSATMGRFVSRDPLRFGAGDVNIFRFVSNDPFGGLDPSGLKKTKAECKALLARIYRNSGKLMGEFMKFDPIRDALGDFVRWDYEKKILVPGKPNGHRTEIQDLQRGLRKDIQNYWQDCQKDDNCGDPPPKVPEDLVELANQRIPKPTDVLNNFFPFPISPFPINLPPIHLPPSPPGPLPWLPPIPIPLVP